MAVASLFCVFGREFIKKAARREGGLLDVLLFGGLRLTSG